MLMLLLACGSVQAATFNLDRFRVNQPGLPITYQGGSVDPSDWTLDYVYDRNLSWLTGDWTHPRTGNYLLHQASGDSAASPDPGEYSNYQWTVGAGMQSELAGYGPWVRYGTYVSTKFRVNEISHDVRYDISLSVLGIDPENMFEMEHCFDGYVDCTTLVSYEGGNVTDATFSGLLPGDGFLLLNFNSFSELPYPEFSEDGLAVFDANYSVTLNAVPLPAAVWLFGSGLGFLAWVRRRSQ